MMFRLLIAVGVGLAAMPVLAQSVQPSGAQAFVLPMSIETPRGRIEITAAPIDPMALPPAADCLPGCVLPVQVAAGVETFAEAEVLAFLSADLASGEAALIDPRLPEIHSAGALPGAINLPLPTILDDNPYRGDVLLALGAVAGADGVLDFAPAKILLIHGNGPWDDEGVQMVRVLLDLGYPAEKLRFYRGGIMDWMAVGLALAKPAVQG